MKINYRPYNLRFKHPFGISRGTKTHQSTLIVELENFGLMGYGEAPEIDYYYIPVTKMIEDIESKRNFLEKFSFTDPERWWHYCHHLFPNNSFLVCALDMAGWDLYGKIKRRKLYELWELDISKNPLTDYTIGIDSIEVMINKMKEMPWPLYKIKLGTEHDVEIITELRKHTSSDFTVDANAAWKADEALEKILAFKHLGVIFIEQPLAKDDWEGMKFLFERSPLPLIADESCVAEMDVQKCYQHFHGINIKLTKCGGLTPAKRMIAKAKELDMKVMVGSMNEGTIGTSAASHLLPLLDYADMDGTLLLAEDVGNGITINNGKIMYGAENGIGVVIKDF